MQTKYEFDGEQDDRIVYVRKVSVKDLPTEVQDQVGEIDSIYAVHRADGEQLALVRDRAMAFVLARENDLAPVAVH